MEINNTKKFTCNCPQCGIERTYANIKNVRKTIRNNSLCKACVGRNKALENLKNNNSYKYYTYSNEETKQLIENWDNNEAFENLIKLFNSTKWVNKLSQFNIICTHTDSQLNPCEDCKKKYLSESGKGENNPFYGKKHTQETKDKLKDSWENPSESKQKYLEYIKSDEGKLDYSRRTSGERNGNFGKPNDLKNKWIQRYGLESGTTKYQIYVELKRSQSSGSNNPMFGKPSPQGSGNGWSGWYKGWFFRSINELSYMINVIEKNNLSWENGELKKYKIPYIDYKGSQRNYFPDFIIGNKIVEIKPTRLHEAPNVKTKTEAAIKFAEERGMTYEIVEVEKISTTEIIELYKNKTITFTEKYEQKFIQKYSHLF